MSQSRSSGNGPSDAQLIVACREGHKDAFGELVERYQDRAFNLAYRLLNNYDDAAEAVQEAFLKAFRGMERFRGEAGFYTWLYRIVVNVVRSRQRFEAVRPKEYRLDAASGGSRRNVNRRSHSLVTGISASTPDPVEEAERMERQELVHEAIGQLDQESRTLIVLRDIQGCNYKEIADLLECPRGTVKSRLHRARKALKEILAPVLAKDQEAAS